MNARLQVMFDEQMSIACSSPRYYQKVSVLIIYWYPLWSDKQAHEEVRHRLSRQSVDELYSPIHLTRSSGFEMYLRIFIDTK